MKNDKKEAIVCLHESVSFVGVFIGSFENDVETMIALIECCDCGERTPASQVRLF